MNFLTVGDSTDPHPAAAGLRACRAELVQLDRSIEEVRKAPLTLDDTRAVIRRDIARAYERHLPDRSVTRYGMPRADKSVPQVLESAEEIALASTTPATLEETLLARCADAMKAKGWNPGLPLAEREIKINAIRGRIASLLREEERLCCEYERATGRLVIRRADADVDAFLDVLDSGSGNDARA